MSIIKCNECDGTGIVDNYYTTPIYDSSSSIYGVGGMSTNSREVLCLKCEGNGHE